MRDLVPDIDKLVTKINSYRFNPGKRQHKNFMIGGPGIVTVFESSEVKLPLKRGELISFQDPIHICGGTELVNLAEF